MTKRFARSWIEGNRFRKSPNGSVYRLTARTSGSRRFSDRAIEDTDATPDEVLRAAHKNINDATM